MTSETKEAVELLVDAIQDHVNEVDDHLAEELNELNDLPTDDRKGITQANSNIRTLQTAKRQLQGAIATLTFLANKNA